MPIYKPTVYPETIRRLVEKASLGELDIPEFQREFVWTKDQVADLLDSLIKGYPIGSLLIWDLNEYTSGRYLEDEKREKEWIVDGQQRIMSLCLILSRKPYWMDEINGTGYLTNIKLR